MRNIFLIIPTPAPSDFRTPISRDLSSTNISTVPMMLTVATITMRLSRMGESCFWSSAQEKRLR